MNNTSNSLVSGIDPASFSAVTGPSQDLFRFVNGPWVDMYRLPDDRSRYGSFDKLAEDAENQIRDILEEDDCPAVKSRALYHSFLDVDAIDAAGLAAIEDQLASIDEAEDKAALTRALGAMNPTGGPDLIGIAVYGDPGAPETNVVHIEQDGLDLPDEAYYREDHYAPIREAYVEMVAKQLKNAHLAAGDEDAHAQAKRFLDVETRIAANHWDNVSTRDSVKTYNPTDYADLCAMLADVDLDAWIDAWQNAYDATTAAAVQPLDFRGCFSHTIVHEPSFLTGLNAFWKEASLDDLKLWARVHVVIGSTLELPHEFDETNFDFYGKTLSGQKEQRVRWKRGVSLVNGICGEDVGREYVKRHFPETSSSVWSSWSAISSTPTVCPSPIPLGLATRPRPRHWRSCPSSCRRSAIRTIGVTIPRWMCARTPASPRTCVPRTCMRPATSWPRWARPSTRTNG